MQDGDAEQYSESGSARHCLDGNCRSRFRIVGFESASASSSFGQAVRRCKGIGSDLWQWRFHLVFREAIATAIGGMGGTRNSASEDEDWRGRGSGREKSPCGAGGDRT